MPAIDAKYIFAVLGPLLLVLGLIRWFGPSPNKLQGRTWLVVGAIFSTVAAWLYWQQVAPH